MKRRSVLGFLVAGASLCLGGLVAIPALLAGLAPALRPRRQPDWRPVGNLSDFPVGRVQAARAVSDRKKWPRTFKEMLVFVWRPTGTEFVVFSRSCTDLGCPLTYDRGSQCFLCPCHGGIFLQDGRRLAGPPERPMHRYAHRVREGILEIDVFSVPPSA